MKKRHLKYVEREKQEPLDWNLELSKTEFTVAEIQELSKLAGNWVTCACGNLCEVIPRTEDGKPKDDQLRLLGTEFYGLVLEQEGHIREQQNIEDIRNDNKKYLASLYLLHEAGKILARIEKRASEILDQMIADEIERNGTVEL